MRQVVIYPGEDGFWVAECPSLPGCIRQGETRARAIANIRDAIRVYGAASVHVRTGISHRFEDRS